MNSSIFIWIIYAIWLIVVVYLTVSAISVKQETKGHLLQSFGLMFAIIAAFLLPFLPIFRFLNYAPVNPILSSIGLILCLAGMAFLVWGRQRLGRNWSQTVSIKKEPELVTSGPYRYVRHPMYAGALLLMGFSPLALGSYWTLLLLVPMFPVLAWRLLDEERFLKQNLPGYANYCRQVRYRLIPGIW